MANPPPSPARTCPACGSPVEPGHKFCPVCGARVPELPVCRNCGAQFIAPVKFCELCGTPVAPDTIPAEEVPDEPEITEPEPVHEPEPVVEPEPYHEPEQAYKPLSAVKPKASPRPEAAVPQPEGEMPEQNPESPLKKNELLPEKERSSARKEPAVAGEVCGTDPLSPAFSGLADLPDRPGPQRPVQKRSLSRGTLMAAGAVVLIIILAAAVYFVGLPMLGSGAAPDSDTAPSAPPAQAPVTPVRGSVAPATTKLPAPEPTHESSPAPQVQVTSAGPLPTQMMPENVAVYFDVQKDQVSGKITILYQRGPGENVLNYAEVRITYPDGTQKTGYLKPSKGDTELLLDGSKQTDRVEVIAYMHNGQSYRIKDEMMAYQPLRDY